MLLPRLAVPVLLPPTPPKPPAVPACGARAFRLRYQPPATYEPSGPYGAKGVGEAANNSTAGAVANAIYNAIGIRFKETPITPEKVLQALREKE